MLSVQVFQAPAGPPSSFRRFDLLICSRIQTTLVTGGVAYGSCSPTCASPGGFAK